jgi:hypothetical protein
MTKDTVLSLLAERMNTSADELAKTYILIDLRERDTNDEIELL